MKFFGCRAVDNINWPSLAVHQLALLPSVIPSPSLRAKKRVEESPSEQPALPALQREPGVKKWHGETKYIAPLSYSRKGVGASFSRPEGGAFLSGTYFWIEVRRVAVLEEPQGDICLRLERTRPVDTVDRHLARARRSQVLEGYPDFSGGQNALLKMFGQIKEVRPSWIQ